jgi:hypothetical protein
MWCGGVGDSTLQVMVWVDPASTNTSLSPSIMARGTEQDKIKYTDKKENEIFLIYKEIQMGSVAKSCMRKGFLICEEMRKYLPIYEEAVSHI